MYLVGTGVSAVLIAVLGRNAWVCWTAGDSAAVRNYLSAILLVVLGLPILWWGYATVRVQRLDEAGVTVLTVHRGQVVIPWASVQQATFQRSSAVLESKRLRARIGFAMYRDPSAAERFARERLGSSGVTID
jgi:hypothetical protein